MIQINLVPNVKQELLQAQRTRSVVISFAILGSLIFAGIVTVLAVYVFAVQGVRSTLADNAIKDEYQKLSSVQDIDKMVTIQSQMGALKEISDIRYSNARIFEVEQAVKPASVQGITIKNINLSPANRIMSLQATALNYSDLEVYKKTIEATQFSYAVDGETMTQPIASNVSVLNAALGDDNSGGRVLNFTISFNYDESLFKTSLSGFKLIPPASQQDVTDSKLAVPNGALNSSGGEN